MKEEIVLTLGGLSEHQHVAETLVLPFLFDVGAIKLCRRAVDLAITSRRGFVIIGPKGAGKSVGLRDACAWYAGIEREKREKDNNYQMTRIRQIRGSRAASAFDLAVAIMKGLSPSYNERVHGRKKDIVDIQQEIVKHCARQNVALLAIDEAQLYSDTALDFLRNLVMEAEESAAEAGVGKAAKGLGVVMLGDESLEHRLNRTDEIGERWAHIQRVDPVGIAGAAHVLNTWFPGFASHVQAVGEIAWSNYLTSTIAPNGITSLRRLENLARAYVFFLVRSRRGVAQPCEHPFDKKAFELAAAEAQWAPAKNSDSSARPASKRGGKSRRSAA